MSSTLGQISAVTLDIGGTLIEPFPSVGDIYAEIGARFGLDGFSPEQLNAGFIAAWKAKKTFDYSKVAWQSLVAASFGLERERLPEGFFETLYDEFNQENRWHIYDDVRPSLTSLREHGFKIGVISNWDERLHILLETLSLTTYFDTITISCDTGFTKPDQRIFKAAASALECDASKILHIGDSKREDIEGTANAGLQTALVNRSGPNREISLSSICDALILKN